MSTANLPRRRPPRHGFTLVEVLVALAITRPLASITTASTRLKLGFGVALVRSTPLKSRPS